MRKAILVVLSILAVSLLMVSCAPQPAGKAVEAELEQLSDAELEQAIAEGEAAESKALAGQAYSAAATQKLLPAYKVAYKRVKAARVKAAAQPAACQQRGWECGELQVNTTKYNCGTCTGGSYCEPTYGKCQFLQ